jgi:hypothetical protein
MVSIVISLKYFYYFDEWKHRKDSDYRVSLLAGVFRSAGLILPGKLYSKISLYYGYFRLKAQGEIFLNQLQFCCSPGPVFFFTRAWDPLAISGFLHSQNSLKVKVFQKEKQLIFQLIGMVHFFAWPKAFSPNLIIRGWRKEIKNWLSFVGGKSKMEP